jgi:hypothetical protein
VSLAALFAANADAQLAEVLSGSMTSSAQRRAPVGTGSTGPDTRAQCLPLVHVGRSKDISPMADAGARSRGADQGLAPNSTSASRIMMP